MQLGGYATVAVKLLRHKSCRRFRRLLSSYESARQSPAEDDFTACLAMTSDAVAQRLCVDTEASSMSRRVRLPAAAWMAVGSVVVARCCSSGSSCSLFIPALQDEQLAARR